MLSIKTNILKLEKNVKTGKKCQLNYHWACLSWEKAHSAEVSRAGWPALLCHYAGVLARRDRCWELKSCPCSVAVDYFPALLWTFNCNVNQKAHFSSLGLALRPVSFNKPLSRNLLIWFRTPLLSDGLSQTQGLWECKACVNGQGKFMLLSFDENSNLMISEDAKAL